jgi:hypothetical protein
VDGTWPRAIDALDRLLGADPDGTADGALGCYEPRLPAPDAIDAAVRGRYDERWREYWGAVGDRLRLLEADGVVVLDRGRGVVCDVATGRPLLQPPVGGDDKGVR